MSQTLYAYWDDATSFTVPEGIDLSDTKKVCWYVRWNTLYIETKDGRKFEIEGDQPQLKKPESCSLLDNEKNTEENIDFNDAFDDSSSEEEESDEEKEDSESD